MAKAADDTAKIGTNNDDLTLEIRESVTELARRAGITPERAFAAWYAINMLDVDEDDALEAAALDGGEDQGVDLLYTDQVNERIIILQAHYPKNAKSATPKSKWDSLATAIPNIDKPEFFRIAGRPELATAAEEAQEHIESFEVLIGTVSLAIKSDQISRSLQALESSGRFDPYRFFYDHQGIVLERFRSAKAGSRSVPEDTLQFEDGKYFETEGEYGHAWVGSVAASELARLYKSHGDHLFSRNVRLFLGTRKGGINEQIVETAKNVPGKFWALNNGITIVADTAKQIKKDGDFKITRFSIVNGCQTTVSLFKAGAPKDAKVLTRLVAANQGVIGDIVRFNNTQNAVKIWTVRAADKIQENLRNIFSKINIDYAPKPETRRSRPKGDEVIALDRIAQFLASRQSTTLIAAVREKSELFDRYYPDIFPHAITSEDVYLAWTLGLQADEARQERLADLTKQGDADKVLTALLGVAGTYWTIHAAFKLIQDLHTPAPRLSLNAMTTEQFKNATKKYVLRGLDEYINISIDTFDTTEYRSVRSALRSPKFLQKFDQKLANKSAGLKGQKKALPSLEAVAQSAPKKASG
ncbi:AIPR family protein [Myxococcus stipitatus]|uniref:AIPR family protein n=1 Tax=Myxococcus stipitatus TaxID=83455 RepID=UPI001F359266|nr:AIPR family protein [Myxococcus stipitatus]MCE9673449.1 AIPR family protein [Myxococcus stipitatus]